MTVYSSASSLFSFLLNAVLDGFTLYTMGIYAVGSPDVRDKHLSTETSSQTATFMSASRELGMEYVLRNIYLLGLGAIGATYLAPLYDVQPDSVRVIVDQRRKASLEEEPVQVNGRAYRFPMITPDEVSEPASLLLVAVKAGQLDEALASASGFIDKDTLVLSLMNGLPPVDTLCKYFDLDQILIGVVYKHATRTGHFVKSGNRGRLILGALSPSLSSERTDSVQHLFRRAGIQCQASTDIHRAAWEKYIINVALNQISGVLRATYGQMNSSHHARELLHEVGEELLELARACGVCLSDQVVINVFELLANLPAKGKTSMLQDLEAGRTTEVAAFAGTVISLGQKYGVSTPRNRLLFHMLRFLEAHGVPPPIPCEHTEGPCSIRTK